MRPGVRCQCGSTEFVSKRGSGERICAQCGTVLDVDNLDKGPDWRIYEDEKKRRAGGPITLLDSDLGIHSKVGSAGDLASLPGRRRKIKRYAKIHYRESSPLKKRMDAILRRVRRGGERLSLARHEVETAAHIMRKTILADTKKRWNHNALAGASIYAACRVNDNPKKVSAIMKSLEIAPDGKREVRRAYKYIASRMNLRPPLKSEHKTLKRMTRNLNLNREILMIANEIIKASEEARIGAGKVPGSIAAASVYIACKLVGKKMTQKKICDAAKTTEVTLRSRIKDIVNDLSISVSV
jgi:transcription initiation factor TFIIB